MEYHQIIKKQAPKKVVKMINIKNKYYKYNKYRKKTIYKARANKLIKNHQNFIYTKYKMNKKKLNLIVILDSEDSLNM